MQGHQSGRFGDRRSTRLPKYNYASRGMYFVTVCARDMECLFGYVGDDGRVTLSEWGQVVEECWRAIPEHFPDVTLDRWITMPNHLHGIVIVRGSDQGDACVAPTNVRSAAASSVRSVAPANVGSGAHGARRGLLGAIVGSFKSAATKQIRDGRNA